MKKPTNYLSLGEHKEPQLFDLEKYPLLNISDGIKKIGSEIILREILVLMAINELPKDLKEVKRAYAQNNWSEIKRLAHRIKGGAIYCGAIKLKFACENIEQCENFLARNPMFCSVLISIMKATLKSINQFLKI